MFEGVVDALEQMATPVTEEDLFKVATISANGDEAIGKIVADAYASVGKDGIVTVENSNSSKTYCEVVKGMRITRGWSSKYMITDVKKQEVVLENPYILMTDQEIANITSIEHILAACIAQNRSILIIGEVSEAAMNALNLNKMKGVIKVGVILPPQFGWKRQEMLQDIAIATGGRYFSDETGDNLSLIGMHDLGTCQKAIISKDSTVLLMGEDNVSASSSHIAEINEMVTNNEEEEKFKAERIANLAGGIAVIYVGAQSDIEQKEKRDRVDDAVCATKAAIEEGILPGGGYALLAATKDNPFLSDLVVSACSAPFYRILYNAGYESLEIEEIQEKFLSTGVGFNPVTEEYGDVVGMGIIDPLKVTKNALKNAVSVAMTIMSTDCIVYNMRAKE
jgi:chaperonin GroEL